jgi:hypothetical protein
MVATRRGTLLRCGAALTTAVSSVLLGAPSWSIMTASAYTAPANIVITDYVTGIGFDWGNTPGPVGLAFDQAGNLFIADYLYGTLFRVPPHVGPIDGFDPSIAESSTGSKAVGLAFTSDGHLYMTHQGSGSTPGDIAEVNPSTLAITRTLTPPIPSNANGLAVDPLSGDLFVVSQGPGLISRISNFAGTGGGVLTTYASNPNLSGLDGIAFGADGTLYGSSMGQVYSFPPTSTPFSGPWVGTVIATVLNAQGGPAPIDGIAVGAGGTPGHPPFLYLNRNDNIMTKVDFSTNPPSQSSVFTDGTRGDFVTVDSNGCVFVSESASVIKVTDPAGNCNPTLVPTNAAATAVTLTNVNTQGDPYFDNVFAPGEPSTIGVTISGRLASALLYVDGSQAMDVSAGGQFTWNPPNNPDGSRLFTSHTLQVMGKDPSGNPVSSQSVVLYALVTARADGVSILPDGAVQYNPFGTDPFQVGCLNFSLPAGSCVGQPPATAPPTTVAVPTFRQDNLVILEGKSNGGTFIEPPRVVKANPLGRSLYCDTGLTTPAVRTNTLSGPFTDSSFTSYVSTLESRVNVTLPNVFSVPTPPGVTGPTNQSDFVPYIYTSVYVAISPLGQTVVKWADQQSAHQTIGNSLFPYAYLYNNGVLASPLPRPTPDLVGWSRTSTASPQRLLNFIEGDFSTNPIEARFLQFAFNTTQPDILAQTILFQAERAECARERFAAFYDGLSQNDEAYLQANFPHLMPVWFLPRYFMNGNILPHFNNWEWSQGLSQLGFIRDYRCIVPGCPGLEHVKVIAILSPVTADVYDAAGNHTGPLSDGTIEDGIPSVTYLKYGQNTFMIVPNDPSLRVVLSGAGSGTFTINSTDYNATTKLEFEQYNNVRVTPSSRGSLTMGSVGTPLNWDVNGTGNGVPVVATTVDTSGLPESADSTPPRTTAILQGTAGQPGYYRSAVDVTFVGRDDLSGTAFTDYSLDGGNTWTAYSETPVHITGDGTYNLLYRSTDYAGNVEVAKSTDFVIDTVPPSISITSPSNGSYILGQPLTAAYSCADSGSGISACTGPVSNGAAIDTSSVGQKTFTVNAADRAGNQGVQSITYAVSYAICALYDQTKSHHIGSTIPIKLLLCDATGNDRSTSAVSVTATGLVEVSSQTSGAPVSDGAANPDNNFRYDSTLGTSGGYIYNLATGGLVTGTYTLSFAVAGDPAVHTVQFQLRP